MKKVFRYLQDQAVQASQQKYSGGAYLSSSSKEPQQRRGHHGAAASSSSPSQYQEAHTTHHQSRSEHPSTAAHSFPTHTTAAGIPRSPRSDGQRDLDRDQDPHSSTHTRPKISDDLLAKNVTRHQYGQDNILQSYDLYIPEPKLKAEPESESESPGYWILYIHGGYFRDPNVTSSSFLPALSRIVASTKTKANTNTNEVEEEGKKENNGIEIDDISGYASINYRLSPHPQKSPQNPHTTPAYELRNAKWPDHLHDVLAGIAHLQQKYAFGERYLLVGHSVGATMALLSTLAAASARSFTTSTGTTTNTTTTTTTAHGDDDRTQQQQQQPPKLLLALPAIEPPLAVLGVSGIYDFPTLHDSFPSYVDLTRNAGIGIGRGIGMMDADADADDDGDVAASPARYTAEEYSRSWAGAGAGVTVANGAATGLDDDDDEKEEEEVVASSTATAKKKKKKNLKPPQNPKRRRVVVLAHSKDDGLVDWRQVEIMKDGFSHGGLVQVQVQVQTKEEEEGQVGIDVKLVEIHGAHNRIWEDGRELARAIGEALRVMRTLD
ncbi:Kynurenine formamidase [Exophiala xenobiotica]|nr:Kynurenine formamidase [Exophiala xenobiotica]